MNKDNLWQNEFGKVRRAWDFNNREIHKGEYGKRSPYGWTIDHIQPLSKNGKDSVENMQIVHWETNELKADKTTFQIEDIIYQVKKIISYNENAWYPEYDYDDKKYLIEIIAGEENYLYSDEEDECDEYDE